MKQISSKHDPKLKRYYNIIRKLQLIKKQFFDYQYTLVTFPCNEKAYVVRKYWKYVYSTYNSIAYFSELTCFIFLQAMIYHNGQKCISHAITQFDIFLYHYVGLKMKYMGRQKGFPARTVFKNTNKILLVLAIRFI